MTHKSHGLGCHVEEPSFGTPVPGTPAGAGPPNFILQRLCQCELMHEVGQDCISFSKSYNMNYNMTFLSDSENSFSRKLKPEHWKGKKRVRAAGRGI